MPSKIRNFVAPQAAELSEADRALLEDEFSIACLGAYDDEAVSPRHIAKPA